MCATHISPCPQQDAGLATHPLCLMQLITERAPVRRAFGRPLRYSTPGVSTGDTQTPFSYVLHGGRHSPKYTNRIRSS